MDNTNFSFEKFNEIEKEYNNSLQKYKEYKQKFIKEFTSKKSYKQFLHSFCNDDVDVESCNITSIEISKFNGLYYIEWDDYYGRGEHDDYSTDNHPLATYLNEHYPALYNECREIVMDAYKINKWSKEVLCVLNNITTLNKLKDEFPEAYDAYVSIYGSNNDDCTKIDRSTGKKMNMCDAIEKVRAEFNSSTK